MSGRRPVEVTNKKHVLTFIAATEISDYIKIWSLLRVDYYEDQPKCDILQKHEVDEI